MKNNDIAKETELLPTETPNRNTFCAILRGKNFRPSQASERLKVCFGSETFTDAPLDRNDYAGFAIIYSSKEQEKLSDFLTYLLDYKQDMKKIKMDTIEVVQTTEHGVFCNIEFSKENVKLLRQLDAQFTVQAKRIPESPNQLVLISGSEDVDGLLERFKGYQNLDDLVWECDEIEVNFWRIYSRKITMAQALELGINYGRMVERQVIEDEKYYAEVREKIRKSNEE